MAKFGGSASSTMNFAKGVSKVTKKSKFVSPAANNIRATRKNLSGIKGSEGLKSVLPKIKPIREDLKQGGIRKINKLVESRVQNLIPKLSNKVDCIFLKFLFFEIDKSFEANKHSSFSL